MQELHLMDDQETSLSFRSTLIIPSKYPPVRRISKGFNVVPLDLFGLSAGTYLLQIKFAQERLVSRFVLVQ
jgi:hypothetical protein